MDALQDCGVGQGPGRTGIYFNWNFDLDVQSMGLLCSVALGFTSTVPQVLRRNTHGIVSVQASVILRELLCSLENLAKRRVKSTLRS